MSLRYTVPISTGDSPSQFYGGLEFKSGNNNYEFGGTQLFDRTVDIFQFSTGGSFVHHDKLGGTALAGNVYISPGGIDANNSRPIFDDARKESNPQYIYGNLAIQRLIQLPKQWEFTSRFTAQTASTNLQGSEEMTAGGATSIRGYGTNSFTGDKGFIWNNDLLTPPVRTFTFGKKHPPLETRLAAFYDWGEVWYKKRIGLDVPTGPLAGAGVGFRMSVSTNFSVIFDYGWQLAKMPDVYHNTEHGHGHFRAVLAF